MDRPYNTLFLIQSLDGKISTGVGVERDVDQDFKRIKGVKEGLHQYYELEQKTDLVSLNSGLVMAKIGVNDRTDTPAQIPVTFVIIDNRPHLKESGLDYLTRWASRLIVVTTNENHPARGDQRIELLNYQEEIDFKDLMKKLKLDFGFDRISIQSGGTLNAQWLRNGFIDEVSIVIAPVLIGGEDTQSLIGGDSLETVEDLKKAKALQLISCEQLANSYLHVKYKVVE